MSIEIIASEEIVDGEEVTIWRLNKDEGTVVVNLNKLLDNGVCECYWLGEKHHYLQVMHVDWTGLEVWAIVSIYGVIIRKYVKSVEHFIEKYYLFIVEMSGVDLGEEAWEYGLEAEDCRMAVINRFGNFTIPPEYDSIKYYDDENIFYTEYKGIKYKFSMDGKIID